MKHIFFSLFLIFTIFIITSNAFADHFADHLHFKVQGIEDPLRKNAEKHLKIEVKSYPKPLSLEDINQFFAKSPTIVKEALQPYGYFKAKVSSKLIKQPQGLLATYNVQKGPAMRITKLNIQIAGEGRDNKNLQKYLKQFPLKINDVFNADKYQEIKDKLFSIANDEGYIKANFQKNEIFLNVKNNTARIEIIFQTDRKYYIGNITFNDNDYSPQFLKRFKPDNWDQTSFSTEKLINYQQSLLSSYYFQNATVTPDFDNIENYHIPVVVDVIPPSAKHYILGIGYGTSTGPRLTAGTSLRRLTKSGHHLDAQVKLSSVLSGFAAKYYIPGKNPITDQWTLASNLQQFMPKNGRSQSITLSAGYQTKIKDLQTNLSLNYLVDHYKITDLPSTHSAILYPSLYLLYTKTDDIIKPMRALYLNFILQGGSKALLSSVSFLQTKLKGKTIFPLFNEQGRLILRAELGQTAVDDLNVLPLSMRFFTGGLNSIRAFKDSSIGPGKYLKVGSIEYQHKIIGNWDGALFYDIGTAADHFNAPLNQSRGLGVIYESIVGPVKLYVAQKNIVRNDNTHKQAYGIELSIGPEF